ncbi:hypothetical protein AB0H00_23435 [Nocardia sp. NPDC023852]|uniref:hypothetical protein n=1 Tax=Nocardia sp. NPDC023852 TaxID=3154697 RepID=UPI0033D436A2
MTIERDRRRTFPLLEQVAAAHTPDAEREAAFDELAQLEDYRSLAPLTALVLDRRLPDAVRRRASEVVSGFDDTTDEEIRRAWWASEEPVVARHALGLMQRTEADIVVPVAGDDEHPWQADALEAMGFGFGEAEFVPVLVRALRHRDATIRKTAADVLLWEEPVAAEDGLLEVAHGLSVEAAEQAMDTLRYYPTRRVLRTLAELRAADDERVRAAAAHSFDEVASEFGGAASSDDPGVALLRDWMQPVHDLVRWTDSVAERPRPPYVKAPPERLTVDALLALLDAPDGGALDQALRSNDWVAYDQSARTLLTQRLVEHPEPGVRENACIALTVWAKTDELLDLSRDRHSVVRKSAMYHLAQVPADPTIAEFSWQCLANLTGTRALEALRTYVVHAPSGQPLQRLTELARSDAREVVRYEAIHILTKLHADKELHSLTPLLHEPPGVTWAVHNVLLDACRKRVLPTPSLRHLAVVDNLHIQMGLAELAARG